MQYGTATGSCGTISWQVEGLKLRLIVMWSVPFNLAIHKSYLAIGKRQCNVIKTVISQYPSNNYVTKGKYFPGKCKKITTKSELKYINHSLHINIFGIMKENCNFKIIHSIFIKQTQEGFIFIFRHGVQWGEVQQRRKVSNIFQMRQKNRNYCLLLI